MIAWAAVLLIRCLRATLRIRHVQVRNLERLPQMIIAFWHDHLLLMLHSRFRRPIMVMVSPSKDGNISAGVFDLYDVRYVRGSSTRGGSSALRSVLKAAAEGTNLVFTPDGPKGPRRVAKDGVVFAAMSSGLPIVPIAFAAKKKSTCDPGTRWSSRSHSPGPSSFTASRWRFHAMPMSSNGVSAWRKP